MVLALPSKRAPIFSLPRDRGRSVTRYVQALETFARRVAAPVIVTRTRPEHAPALVSVPETRTRPRVFFTASESFGANRWTVTTRVAVACWLAPSMATAISVLRPTSAPVILYAHANGGATASHTSRSPSKNWTLMTPRSSETSTARGGGALPRNAAPAVGVLHVTAGGWSSRFGAPATIATGAFSQSDTRSNWSIVAVSLPPWQ